MKFTYDPRYNIAYIRFQERRTEVEAVRMSDELVVDIAQTEQSMEPNCSILTNSYGVRTRTMVSSL